MEKTKEQAFREEVIALMYCGYSFDNAVQTALEHQEERGQDKCESH